MKKEVFLNLDMSNINDYVFFEVRFIVIDANNKEHKVKTSIPLLKSESVINLKDMIELVVDSYFDHYDALYLKVTSIKLKAQLEVHQDVN